MTTNYICIELKTNDEGGTAAEVLCSTADRNYAESVYHGALAKAATSGRACHAAVLLGSDGAFYDSRAYAKEVADA